jgi:SAM-dependent methyltransferase
MTDKNYLQDPKKRFSSRVDNYIKYRPHYPTEIINFLTKHKILNNSSTIADIGSGTGILSELFLKNGNKVFGIEPNKDMREAGELLLKKYSNFVSLDGSAESTKLKKNFIDLIIAGQSFHWFELNETKREFKRILKPNGYVVLVWNSRKKNMVGFPNDYEKLIMKYGTDVKEVRKSEKKVDAFFNYEKIFFYNYQELNYEGLKGRLLSTSYIPLDENENYRDMISELEKIFKKYQRKGKIKVEYDTELYYGKLT